MTSPTGSFAVKNWLACIVLLACVRTAAAEPGAIHDLGVDAKLYFTAPLRWEGRDWLHFGETLALIGLAHQYDDDVRTHFTAGMQSPLDGRDPHELRDAAPAALIVLGTWSAAFLAQNRDGYEEGREMLES